MVTSPEQPSSVVGADECVEADVCLREWAEQVLARWETVGLAVGVARADEVAFETRGLSDIATGVGVDEDTLFRIGSITKTFTAIAVMQLWERGLVGLDDPARDHLGEVRLLSPTSTWRPVTIRHLLTHTSGIPDVLRVRDLMHPSWGPFAGRPPLPSVEAGKRIPSVTECYRDGIRIVAEPGSTFAYSNHGFALLGQIVENVSGEALDVYFARHIFDVLGMDDTTLLRPDPSKVSLARGHEMRVSGPRPVTDREWVGGAGGGVYSSCRDLLRYVRALLNGGSNRYGSVLGSSTLAEMFDYHYRPDRRLGGMGLGFFRHDVEGHRLLGHDGILPGFNSSLIMAPEDGSGVIAVTNGAKAAMVWLPEETERLLHRLVGIDRGHPGRGPEHPEIWGRVCGRYRLPVVADLRGRVVMGGGLEIRVEDGRLMGRLLTPVPALYRGFALHAEDPDDPYLFSMDLSTLGMAPVRIAFARDDDGRRLAHTALGGQPITLYEAPSSATGRRRPSPLARLTSPVPPSDAPERPIDRLSDLDQVMLGASRTWPQDIGALLILDGAKLLDSNGEPAMETIREAIEARIHLVPRLRQLIHMPGAGLGGPLWVDDRRFDLANHLIEVAVEPPGGERQLAAAVEQIRSRPLDPAHPLWEMCLLTGLPDQQLALYVRLHHTIGDGMAAMASIVAMLDTEGHPVGPTPPPWRPGSPPTYEVLRRDHRERRKARRAQLLHRVAHPLRMARETWGAWPGVRELIAEEPATRTSLDRMVGASRDMALVRTDLELVKTVAQEHAATVNDVLLTSVAGGLRSLLEARGENARETTIRVFVPISLRRGDTSPRQGNQIAQMVVPLRLDELDPRRRLVTIAAETARRKRRSRASLEVLMHGRLMRRLALGLVMHQRVNATTASIPGPTAPLSLSGACVLEVYPVLPLIANEPLGVGALSYAGGLYIGITVDADAVPDLAIFAQGLSRDLESLIAQGPSGTTSGDEETNR